MAANSPHIMWLDHTGAYFRAILCYCGSNTKPQLKTNTNQHINNAYPTPVSPSHSVSSIDPQFDSQIALNEIELSVPDSSPTASSSPTVGSDAEKNTITRAIANVSAWSRSGRIELLSPTDSSLLNSTFPRTDPTQLPPFLAARHRNSTDKNDGNTKCRLVLLKAGAARHTSQEVIDRLAFDAIVREKIFRAEWESIQGDNADNKEKSYSTHFRGSSVGTNDSVDNSYSSPSLFPSARSPQSRRTLSILPHLRSLPDSRIALVLQDPGALLLQQAVHQQWQALTAVSLDTMSVVSGKGLPMGKGPWASPLQHSSEIVASSSFMSPPNSNISSGTTSSTTSSSSSSNVTVALSETAHSTPLPKSLSTALNLSFVQWVLTQTLTIAQKLHMLHSHSLLHRSLQLSSIIVNSHSKPSMVEFLDLSSASLTSPAKALSPVELQALPLSSFLYMAPEQSGKANNVIDARTDLYSLGVILFEMLTGRPPFNSTDQLELMHAHLARSVPSIMPPYLQAAAHTQPFLYSLMLVIDAMVRKLLAKAADDRYQSAAGLISDLRQLLGLVQVEQGHADKADMALSPPLAMSQTGSPLDLSSSVSSQNASPGVISLQQFRVGQLDHHSTFRISQRLYGRENDVRALLNAYRQACAGDKHTPAAGVPHLCLIRGYSGVGKTSLVDELHKHLLRSGGLFARSKFDLLKRDASCLLQAFRSLLVQLQVQDALTWKVKIMRALGSNSLVLVDVLPELRCFLDGPLPAIPKLSTAETAVRFNQVFMQFVACLATKHTPLCIFIDDLQWADSGSLALLQLLLSHESAYVFVVGAYRDNEVDSGHRLVRAIAQVKSTRGADRVTEVSLTPLRLPHITQMVVDSFRCSEAEAAPLAQLLLSKTDGNPFFIAQMLKSFYDSGLLQFDFDSGKWRWAIDAIRCAPVHEDVVDLLCAHMLTFSSASQQMLQYAACLGNSFNLQSLSVITQLRMEEMLDSVLLLEKAGMLMCTSHAHDLALLAERWKRHESNDPVGSSIIATDANSTLPPACLPSTPTDSSPTSLLSLLSNITLCFVHDKIQTAAYRLIPPESLSSIHCSIAGQLLHHLSDSECEEYAIDIVGHVNVGYLEPLQRRLRTNNDGATVVMDSIDRLANSPITTVSISDDSVDCFPPDALASWTRLLHSRRTMARLIELEILAGKQAKMATAYDSALKFFSAALMLVVQMCPGASMTAVAGTVQRDSNNNFNGVPTSPSPSSPTPSVDINLIEVDGVCWQHAYSFCRKIYVELAQTLFLFPNYALAQQCAEFYLSHVHDVNDRSLMFDLHLQTLGQQSRMQEAVDVGLAHLHELGIELLPEMTPELKKWVFSFPDLSDESTFHQHPALALEEMSHPIVMTLLTSVCPALFWLNSPVFVHVIITMLHLTMTRGSVPESSYAFACYALIIWPEHRRYPEMYALGRLAKLILEQYGETARSILSRTNTAVLGGIFPWKMRFTTCAELIEAGFEEAMAIGDNEWGGYVGMYWADVLFVSCLPLPHVLEKFDSLLYVLRKQQHPMAVGYVEQLRTCCRVLAGEQEDSLKSDVSLPSHSTAIMLLNACNSRGVQHLFGRRYGVALAHFELASTVVAKVPALIINLPYVFYHCLSLLLTCNVGHFEAGTAETFVAPDFELASITPSSPNSSFLHIPPDYDGDLIKKRLTAAKPLMDLMAVWSTNAPHNFRHKLLLMQAEQARVIALSHLNRQDLVLTAMDLYDSAADAAHFEEMYLEEALCLELAGRFYTQIGRQRIARMLFIKSQSAYEACGAMEPCNRLRKELGNDGGSSSGDTSSSYSYSESLPRLPLSARSTSQDKDRFHSHSRVGGQKNTPHGRGSSTLTSSESIRQTSKSLEQLRMSGESSGNSRNISSSSSMTSSSSSSNLPRSPSRDHLQECDVVDSMGARGSKWTQPTVSNPAANASSAYTQYTSGSKNDPNAAALSHVLSSSSFDALSVLKATASFSTETNPSKLLKRLMSIVLETAGATRGVLVLQDSQTKEWSIELRGRVRTKDSEDEEDEQAEANNANSNTNFNSSRNQQLDITSGVPVALSRSSSFAGVPSSSSSSTFTSTELSSSEYRKEIVQTTEAPLAGAVELQRNQFAALSPPDGTFSTSSSPIPISSSASIHSSPSTASLRNQSREEDEAAEKINSMASSMPLSVFHFVIRTVETVVLSEPHASQDFSAFASDPYFHSHHPRACLCMPVLKQGVVIAVLYIENDFEPHAFTSSHIQLLQLLCGQAALSIDNARAHAQIAASNLSLQQLVLARTAELETLQRTMRAAEKAMRIKSEFLSNVWRKNQAQEKYLLIKGCSRVLLIALCLCHVCFQQMSHEIRTPMNAVLGVGRLLAETQLSLEQQQLVEMIDNSGRLLLAIINDILDLSKMEAGHLKLHLAPHNVLDVVENAVMLCYDMAASKGLSVSWDVDPHCEPALMLDSTRLQQILLNLLSNAIKFTTVGGVSLSVSCRDVMKELVPFPHLHGQPSKERQSASEQRSHRKQELQFSVTDTGVGIAAEHLQLLFQAFSQIHHMSAEYGGTGLGLVISRRLVSAMGGTPIEVESEIGKGSTFTFRIQWDVADATTADGGADSKTTSLAQSDKQNQESSTSVMQQATSVAHPSSGSSTTISHTLFLRSLHGLDASQRFRLSSLRILFVGNQFGSAVWKSLLRFYGTHLYGCEDADVARTWIQEGANFEAADQRRNSANSTNAAAAAGNLSDGIVNHDVRINERPMCDLVIIDLDSRHSFNESLLDSLLSFAPLRLLFLYSKKHVSSLPVELNANSILAATAAAANSGSAVPMVSSLTALRSRAPAQPLSAVNSSVFLADATPERTPERTMRTLLQRSSSHPIAIQRHLKKPFKIAAFLHAVLAVSSLTIPENSDSQTQMQITKELEQDNQDNHTTSVPQPDVEQTGNHSNGRQPSTIVEPPSHPPNARKSSASAATAASSGDFLPSANNSTSDLLLSSVSSPSSASSSRAVASHSGHSMTPRAKLSPISGRYPLRVLLAEDNVINQKVMTMLMKKLGYEMLIASHGKEVLETLEIEAAKGKEFEIQCILMDASMDVMVRKHNT